MNAFKSVARTQRVKQDSQMFGLKSENMRICYGVLNMQNVFIFYVYFYMICTKSKNNKLHVLLL